MSITEHINEAVIVVGLLTEVIILAAKQNGNLIPLTTPLTVAVLLWMYIYFSLIGIGRRVP